jgi:hypothetical protein
LLSQEHIYGRSQLDEVFGNLGLMSETSIFDAFEPVMRVVGGVRKFRQDKSVSDDFGGLVVQADRLGLGDGAFGVPEVEKWCEENGYVSLRGREGPFSCLGYELYVYPIEKVK